MIILYLIACIPLFIGGFLFINSKQINWTEWLGGSLSGFIIAGIVHGIVFYSLTCDTETWSGKVTTARYEPPWVEQYLEAIYRTESHTDDEGNTYTEQVFDHYETRYRDHGPDWEICCDVGLKQFTVDISQEIYNDLLKKFGKKEAREGDRPGYYSGDENDYWLVNINNYFQPMNTTYNFENKIKCSKSIYSFIEVPPNISVYDYPVNNLLQSNRLLGTSNQKISILEFDRLNSFLGPFKLVNIIIVGFPKNSDPMISKYQEAKWIGGKKNDIVICYAEGDNNKVSWSYCFGWTDKTLVKRNLETIFLENEVNNNILEKIKIEISKNYIIKDWSQFDYLTIDPPFWSYIVLIIVMIIVQVILWSLFLNNDYRNDKIKL
jgi:hypothetical protein